MKNNYLALLSLAVLAFILTSAAPALAWELGEPQIDFNPRSYAAPKIDDYIYIDGKLTDKEWVEAPWSDYFVDISGEDFPTPHLKTRFKMMWNDYYLYIAAKLAEPHVWATLQKRDSVIFYDNDFEVFIDPDGDTHNYFELEINALGTVWDLLLLHPYRDGGTVAIDSWDIQSLQSAVYVDGTINDPRSRDNAWYVEIGIPWSVLAETADQAPPQIGDYWRINFSRVQWQHQIVDDQYQKIPDTPEANWVWTPQGLINMHYPEMWGFVYFLDEVPSYSATITGFSSIENAKWLLRQLYYKQFNFFQSYGYYAEDIKLLDWQPDDLYGFSESPIIQTTNSMFEAMITRPNSNNIIHINHLGKTWISSKSDK